MDWPQLFVVTDVELYKYIIGELIYSSIIYTGPISLVLERSLRNRDVVSSIPARAMAASKPWA